MLLFPHLTFAAEKITVLLDWFLNPSHAPLFVAEQQGFFKKQNLDVTLISPAESSDPPKLIAAGQGDIGIDYQPQYLQQINRGMPLAVIGELIDKPLNCMAVLDNSGIRDIKDLRGKTIGHSTGELNGVMLKTMLNKEGLSLKDVNSINLHFDLVQALLTHKVDAVTGLSRNLEPIQIAMHKQAVRVFYPESNGIPTYAELIFVVNKDKVNDPRWKPFLAAVKQGQEYLQAHPKEMWDAFVLTYPELNNELNKRAWFVSLPYFAKDPEKIDQKKWDAFAAFMKKNQL